MASRIAHNHLGPLFASVRGRLFARAAVRDALDEVARHEAGRDVRAVLADVLGDPSLQLYFWAQDAHAYVDARGCPARLGDVDGRTVTEIRWSGERIAAIVHARTLDESPGVVEAAGAGGVLALENAGLEAKLRASTTELRASRGRMYAAGAAERRRIERDLHDGAQNRLVALRIELGLAAEQAADIAADDLHETLVALGDDVQEALDGVRAIAHGIYPPLLASSGLRAALAAEAEHAPIPVQFAEGTIARSTHDAEAAVYFCCLEAIQNVCKHAGPEARVTVRLRYDGQRLAFSVEDDGAGFDPGELASSAGMTHVRDRISAVGGDLDVTSAPGRGTTVSGTAPWPARAVGP